MTDDEIERWCRSEMRALIDSPVHRRGEAILALLARARIAEKAERERDEAVGLLLGYVGALQVAGSDAQDTWDARARIIAWAERHISTRKP
jgi:hypothetical protein